MPRHVIEKYGREWTKPGNMVGNGPYVLAERMPQNYSKLVRNPNFFAADTVKIDEIYWYPTQDLGTSLRRFRAGELDIVLNFPPDEIDWIKANMPAVAAHRAFARFLLPHDQHARASRSMTRACARRCRSPSIAKR